MLLSHTRHSFRVSLDSLDNLGLTTQSPRLVSNWPHSSFCLASAGFRLEYHTHLPSDNGIRSGWAWRTSYPLQRVCRHRLRDIWHLGFFIHLVISYSTQIFPWVSKSHFQTSIKWTEITDLRTSLKVSGRNTNRSKHPWQSCDSIYVVTSVSLSPQLMVTQIPQDSFDH